MGGVTNCCKAATASQSDVMDDLKEQRKQSMAATEQSIFTQVSDSVHKEKRPRQDTYQEDWNQAEEQAKEAEKQAKEAEEKAQQQQENEIHVGSKDIKKELKDHSTTGDDVKKVKNFDKLDPYQKFEKDFPFFRMDVNGYCLHVREAVVIDVKNQEKEVEQNHYHQSEVSLESLQKTFANYESWSDFNDPNSAFVKLLQELCPPTEQDDSGEIWFDVHRIKLVGILWCDGKPNEKITELYHVLQDNKQTVIAFNDKEVPLIFKIIFDFATVQVFERTMKNPQLAEGLNQISEDRIKEVQETYDEIIEQFVDTVFEEESKLSNDDWQKFTTKKADWIVQPDQIRFKLYPELEYLKQKSWF